MKHVWLILILLALPASSVFAEDVQSLKAEVQQLRAKIEDLTLDRNNLLKQATTFQTEKDALTAQIEKIQGKTSGASMELETMKSESEILQSEISELKAAREKDRLMAAQERQKLEAKLEEAYERADSIARAMEQYTPEKIEAMTEDRNRLAEENQRMAQRIFEYEKQMEEMRRQMTPLELDREELHRIHEENRELKKRTAYVSKLESRQEELISENRKFREEVEVLKAKIKESVPGLAKASRVSQKMMRENADMHYNLGTIFLHNKQFPEAIREYERVLELRPGDPSTHYNLGILYDDYLKDREKALYHYQKYLAISPKAPDAKRIESYILQLELEQKVR